MIGVILLTYRRTAYATRALESLIANWRGEPFHLHVADDGSDPAHREALCSVAAAAGGPRGIYPVVADLTVTNAERSGYGASYNLATQVVHRVADVVLPLEDDWELVREFEAARWAAALADAGCIRLGYLGWTHECRGELVPVGGLPALRFDPASEEQHLWAGHPRLETRDFERRLGPWPEGLTAGETELAVSGRAAAREGVVFPLELVGRPLWVHIGSEKA